jgi:hypothetical protein
LSFTDLEPQFQKAIQIKDQSNRRYRLRDLIVLAGNEGKPELALKALEESKKIILSKDFKFKSIRCEELIDLANTAYRNGQKGYALSLINLAVKQIRSDANNDQRERIYASCASTYAEMAMFNEALQFLTTIKDPWKRYDVFCDMAWAAAKRNDTRLFKMYIGKANKARQEYLKKTDKKYHEEAIEKFNSKMISVYLTNDDFDSAIGLVKQQKTPKTQVKDRINIMNSLIKKAS